MQHSSAHKQYTNVQITSVDKGTLLLMLYEGCIKFLKQARAGLESSDLSKFGRFLSKSQAIISELMLTLDFEKGGKIARDLDRIYDFMLFYLTEANLEKNPAKVSKVIDLLEIIAGAYREVITGHKTGLPDDLLQAAQPDAPAASKDSKKEEAPAGPVPRSISVSF